MRAVRETCDAFVPLPPMAFPAALHARRREYHSTGRRNSFPPGVYFAPPIPMRISTLFWLLPTTHKRDDMRQARQDQKQREIHIPSRTRACMQAVRLLRPFPSPHSPREPRFTCWWKRNHWEKDMPGMASAKRTRKRSCTSRRWRTMLAACQCTRRGW